MDSALLQSLRRALELDPDDIALRLHLADLLLTAGHRDEAMSVVAVALHRDPTDDDARQLMRRALGGAAAATGYGPAGPGGTPADEPPNRDETPPDTGTDFDWHAAERDVQDVVPPTFATPAPDVRAAGPALEVVRPTLTLADVAGMDEAKSRLNAAFLAPLRNPTLRRLYAKNLTGGLLLYGPPGCGKTFLARALAGELDASFLSVGVTDILDPFLGASERNVHEAFQLARREAPCVLFFDEVDSLGSRRSRVGSDTLRGVVNQLLVELDGLDSDGHNTDNEGVFVLAATNQPWDVDPALRRPGRLDRSVLVAPPDRPARRAIFAYHLRNRPIGTVDLDVLARDSDGLSGADIAYVCELAVEHALMDSAASGTARLVGMPDLRLGLSSAVPSSAPWFESARNVVLFGNADGSYRELEKYLKKTKRL